MGAEVEAQATKEEQGWRGTEANVTPNRTKTRDKIIF